MSLLEISISELQKELDVPVYLLGYELFFEAIQIYTTDYHLPFAKVSILNQRKNTKSPLSKLRPASME